MKRSFNFIFQHFLLNLPWKIIHQYKKMSSWNPMEKKIMKKHVNIVLPWGVFSSKYQNGYIVNWKSKLFCHLIALIHDIEFFREKKHFSPHTFNHLHACAFLSASLFNSWYNRLIACFKHQTVYYSLFVWLLLCCEYWEGLMNRIFYFVSTKVSLQQSLIWLNDNVNSKKKVL